MMVVATVSKENTIGTIARIGNRQLYIPPSDRFHTEGRSLRIANAMALELLNYGIHPSADLVHRIATHEEDTAQKYADQILESYTIGDLNPPLFENWESRTSFTNTEFLIQICGYLLQVSGNDLDDQNYMIRLKSKVDFEGFKKLDLVDSEQARSRFHKLVRSAVALDRKTRKDLISLAGTYYFESPQNIKSDEARIAVLVGMVKAGVALRAAMLFLSCRPADALRFAAAMHDFEGVKLPADVRYSNLPWLQRRQLVSFLSDSSFDDLCEAMSNNRTAWVRFFKHIHLRKQRLYRNSFTNVVAASLVTTGSVPNVAWPVVTKYLRAHSRHYAITPAGNMAYRSFASRVQTAVENKDLETLAAEVRTRPSYLLRNLASLSHVCTEKTENQFVELVQSFIGDAKPGVLFSLVQIDPDAEYRIIDSKGNTTVTEANYSPVIAQIQGLAEREISRRFGFKGQMTVQDSLQNSIVPFLSTNAELDRGTRIPFEDAPYLYFLMHWVQRPGTRTDLDHSYICFDAAWNAETIYFGNQANSFIKQSGDITNAPAPKGATEYGRIDLHKIPHRVRYIVPICNVFSGDLFSENETAYAGFMFSDQAKFSIQRDHVRYDLSQPAAANVPFVIDVRNKEIMIVDFNNRVKRGWTAHADIGDLRKIISALKTKKFMTIGRLASLLSGKESDLDKHVCKDPVRDIDIAPADLFSLFE